MKKIIFSFVLLTSLCSLSFALKPQLPIEGIPTSTAENDIVLQKWFKENHIAGKTVSTENDVKILPNFPSQFKNFTVRILKFNSAATMDYSYERLNINLDKNGKILRVFIG